MSVKFKKTPNARINPAGSIVSSLQSWRMKDKLMPLGLNELLDRLSAATRAPAAFFLLASGRCFLACLTPELTRAERTPFNLHRRKHDEKAAIEASG
jgi:hypothetical protein